MSRQVPNYRLFQNIRWYLYWYKFLQVIFCYLNCTCTVQLIRGVSHLDIPFIGWFWHHQGPLLCFLETIKSPENTKSQRSWKQGFRRCHNGWCTDILEAFLNTSLRSAHFIDETSWYKTKLSYYSPLLLDYKDFQVIRCQIKWIVLYMPKFVKCVINREQNPLLFHLLVEVGSISQSQWGTGQLPLEWFWSNFIFGIFTNTGQFTQIDINLENSNRHFLWRCTYEYICDHILPLLLFIITNLKSMDNNSLCALEVPCPVDIPVFVLVHWAWIFAHSFSCMFSL